MLETMTEKSTWITEHEEKNDSAAFVLSDRMKVDRLDDFFGKSMKRSEKGHPRNSRELFDGSSRERTIRTSFWHQRHHTQGATIKPCRRKGSMKGSERGCPKRIHRPLVSEQSGGHMARNWDQVKTKEG